MQKAHPRTPVRDFPIPENITFSRTEPWSGTPAYPGYDEAIWIPFVRGSLPYQHLNGYPLNSFNQLITAPTMPNPPQTGGLQLKCSTLKCI